MDNATIAAIATPVGPGAIGIVRVSGSDASQIARQVFRTTRTGNPPRLDRSTSHRLIHGTLFDPADGTPIDDVLLGWMAAPRTYTREDTVEFSCHGGSVPVRETLRVLLAAGARVAEPGEFTLRAFLNGRLDLTQAEAVLNLVGARTSEGLHLAVADLAGDLTRRLQPARDALVSLVAYLDAAADFPDDEIPSIDVPADLAAAESALDEVVAGSRAGMLYRDGVQVALIGRPNVGKSSLLNALLRTERAIVTPIAGTTRDLIAETINLGGIPITLLDTAGITPTNDPIEALGIARSHRAAAAAAVAVLVLDGSVPPSTEDRAILDTLAERLPRETGPLPVIVAVSKADLTPRCDQKPLTAHLPGSPVIAVSSLTGSGIGQLESAIGTLLAATGPNLAKPALISDRQHAALDRALGHVRDAKSAQTVGYPIDLLATDVRAALHAVGSVTGEAVDDAVLTEIFSRFCIGK